MTQEQSKDIPVLYYPTDGYCGEIHKSIVSAGGRGLVIPEEMIDSSCAHPEGCCWSPWEDENLDPTFESKEKE